MPHSCWLAWSPSPTKTDRMQGRVVLGQVGPLSANHSSLSSSPPRAWITSAEAQRLMVPDRYPVLKGRLCACGGNPFPSRPPGTYGRIKTAAGGRVEIRPRQDADEFSYQPLPPFIWRIYLSATWLNLGNRLNISAIHPSADLDISQSHANQIPKSLASPHCKDHPPSRFAELQGAPDLGGGVVRCFWRWGSTARR